LRMRDDVQRQVRLARMVDRAPDLEGDAPSRDAQDDEQHPCLPVHDLAHVRPPRSSYFHRSRAGTLPVARRFLIGSDFPTRLLTPPHHFAAPGLPDANGRATLAVPSRGDATPSRTPAGYLQSRKTHTDHPLHRGCTFH